MDNEKNINFWCIRSNGWGNYRCITSRYTNSSADIYTWDYPDNVEPFLFDINHSPADIAPLFANVERMFLLWPPGENVKKSMAQLIAAAANHGVKQVVFLSILGAEKLKIVPHRTVEKMLEASGMDWVFLRSAYFMQNLSGMHARDP